MDTSSMENGMSFEKALLIALSRNNFLLPMEEDQAAKFEKELSPVQTIPDEFSDPMSCISRKDDNLRSLSSDLFDTNDLYNLRVASLRDENGTEDEN